MTERRFIQPEEMAAMQNGQIRPIHPPQPEPEIPAALNHDPEGEESSEQHGGYEGQQIPRDLYETIGQQYMRENAPVPMRQQLAQMAGQPPQGEALIEWSKGTVFGISIGIALGAGVAYLVVRNHFPGEESSGAGSESS